MPRAKSNRTKAEYLAISQQSAALNEARDCAVVAVSAVTGASYETVHRTMKELGRRDRKGTSTSVITQALVALGFRAVSVTMSSIVGRYPAPHNRLRGVTSHHPERFAKVWPAGKFLLFTRRHVLAIVDGKNCDWSVGRSLRGEYMLLVEKVA